MHRDRAAAHPPCLNDIEPVDDDRAQVTRFSGRHGRNRLLHELP
jgi:hypothetical protein